MRTRLASLSITLNESMMSIKYQHLNIFAILAAVSLILPSCGNSGNDSDSASMLAEAAEHRVAREMKNLPPCQNGRFRVNNLGNLAEMFNDSNKYQYAVAERYGIRPVDDIRKAYHTNRPLVKIESCDAYMLDSLTHSMPYLVPEAASLLRTIGLNFIDSLASRGEGGYKIKVTSVLRTPQSVKRLRRVNVNATDSSTHQFGTTFDISWTKFCCQDPNHTLHEGDLKNLLAEVLADLRKNGKCLVKFEKKTACFHITAIP